MWTMVKRQGKHVWSAYRRWQDDDGTLMSAAVAYYLGLSLFPLLMILIACMGLFLRFTATGQDAQQEILDIVSQNASPAVESQLSLLLEQIKGKSAQGGPIGILGLVLVSIASFLQFERAFDHIWNIEDKPQHGILAGLKHALVERAVAFSIMLGLGMLIVIIFVSGLALTAAENWAKAHRYVLLIPGPALRVLLGFSLNTGVFTLLYRYLPKPFVSWREAVRGGVFVAVGWEIGSQLLAAFIIGDKYVTAYGVVGAFMALLLWYFYGAALILLGAEYIQVRHEHANIADGK